MPGLRLAGRQGGEMPVSFPEIYPVRVDVEHGEVVFHRILAHRNMAIQNRIVAQPARIVPEWGISRRSGIGVAFLGFDPLAVADHILPHPHLPIELGTAASV